MGGRGGPACRRRPRSRVGKGGQKKKETVRSAPEGNGEEESGETGGGERRGEEFQGGSEDY